MMEKSCGAVVFTRVQAEIRYVLVRSLEGKYGFPKGHMEGSETETETAMREIREEVGLTPDFLPGFRETTGYILPGTQIQKQVVFFLAEYSNQTPVYQKEELQGYVLVPYGEALALLPHEDQKGVLRKADAFLQNR